MRTPAASAPDGPATLTVSGYLEEWLQVEASQVQPSTWQEYRRAIRNYVEDEIGGLALDALTVLDLNRLYARLHADGGSKRTRLSRKTVRYVHAVLHKAFEDAIVLGLLTANPAHRAIVPKRDHDPDAGADLPFTVWSAEQLRTFLEHTRTDRFADVWLMAAMTGMRRGELLGLGWDDVDCDADPPWLRVRRSLSVVAGRARLKEPKTMRPRTLHLDPLTVAALRRQHARQASHRRKQEPSWDNRWNLVFTDDHGRHLVPDTVSQAFRRLVRTVPVPPLRLHDLRHLHATLMLQAGVPVKVVSERLGHASTQMTMDTYAHVLPAMDADAVDAFARHVFGEDP